MNKIRRVISLILLVIILIGVVPFNTVEASTANFMSAKMISFFQSGQENIEMSEVSESELRVYGVFLSNFLTPMETRLFDLSVNNESNNKVAQQISKIFFGSEGNTSKVGELNEIIYKASLSSLKTGKLTNKDKEAVSGQDFLNAMISDGDNAKLYFNNQLAIDFKEDSFRGAFKILAAQSAGIIFDKNYGIAGMSSLYLDCFGNMWGAFPITRTVGETTEQSETQDTKLHLVLPACLNPTAFFNHQGNKSLADTKIPLNNAFAMGSIVESENISPAFSSDALVPYYNIPAYLSGNDRDNALFVYGINSPFDYIYNTDSINGNVDTESKLNEFFSNNYSSTNNYKIVMSNRLDVMKNTLSTNDNWFNEDTNRLEIIEYLYGALVIDLNKTYTDIYYFGESGNASWANSTFEDIGMTGINMFGTQQEGQETPDNKSDDVWYIYDGNQKTTKLTELMKDSRGTVGTTPYKVRENLGVVVDENWLIENIAKVDVSTLNTTGITFVSKNAMQSIDTTKFNLLSAGKYYIHGVSAAGDSKLYSKLVELLESNVYMNTWVDWYTKVVTPLSGVLFSSKSSFNVFGADTIQEEVLFHNLHTYAVSGGKLKAVKDRVDNIEVVKIDSDKGSLTVTNSRIASEANWPGIFWGYMVEMFDMRNMVTINEDGTANYDVKDFYSEYLPKLPDGIVSGGRINLTPLDAESGVANSSELTMEETQKDLIKKIYGIVSDKPNSYRDGWIKSTLDGFIINTHKAITGSWIANVSNIATVSSENMTSYSSVVGYIHTPSMYDLPFTSWVMNNYMQIYILALLIVMIFVILMVLLSMRTWRQGVMIFLLMTVGLLLPNILIENTINIGNKAADSIYSDRFDFWALTQHQQSLIRLQGAVDTSSMDYIIQSSSEKAKNVYSQDAGVRIKWMAPKKTDMFSSFFDSNNVSTNLVTNLTIFKWLSSSFVYQQEFVGNDPFATYLYRPYNAIAADALDYYNIASGNQHFIDSTKSRPTVSIKMMNNKQEEKIESISIPEFTDYILQNINTDYSKRYKENFYGSAVWGNKELLKTDNVFEIYWSQDKYTDIVEKVSQYPMTASIEKNSVSLWGLGNAKVTDIIITDGGLGVRTGPDLPESIEKIKDINNIDDIHTIGFYKNTESPFYYFYNTLKYRYGSSSFKSSLLNNDIFMVRDGELSSSTRSASNSVRDFLDLEGLFTNVIPYMTMSNDYVYGWTSVHGTEVPEFTFHESGSSEEMSNDTRKTYNELSDLKSGMRTVWNMYAPWVDQINSLDVYNEKVGIGGKRVNVENILNPSFYLKAGRPMIFSEADMIAKGYRESDLSDIENRIQRVLDTTYRDLQYLVNYYDMDDEVLINAAAMYATFNFNREFSQNSIIGKTVMLYPQGFEMKNFNYDAFMRLIMLNSTGETIFSADGDLYERVLSKTSFFTGLMLLITDILGVIMIPTMKLLILLMLMFLGILLCITCVVSPPEKLLEAISKSLMLPALLFLIANITFALVVSFLVGEGLTSYVGSKGMSITTNDPTITIALLILINSIYCVSLFKIIKMLFDKYKSYGVSTFQAGLGIVGGVGLAGLSAVKKAANKTGKGISNVGNTAGGAVVGSAMAGKGNRMKGALDGAMTGSRGGSVYNQRRNEQRIAEEQSRFGGLADEINKKASGKSKNEDTDMSTKQSTSNKQSKTNKPKGLKKEDYAKDGTKLGNKIEDLVYTKNKVQDKVNETKHNLNSRKTEILGRVGSGFEDAKKKGQENMEKAQYTVKRIKTTTGNIVSGKYFNDSIEQGKEKDTVYKAKRRDLDMRRATQFEPTAKQTSRITKEPDNVNKATRKSRTKTGKIIDTMKGKGGIKNG